MSLTVRRGVTVLDGGKTVATLWWSGGRVAAVKLPDGTVAGRLLADGDIAEPGPVTYCAFTALSPAAWTPSDTEIAGHVPIEAAVAAVLNRSKTCQS